MGKKQIWFEVEENETIEQCLERMKEQGYMAMGRKEEPVFHVVDGEPTYLRQKVKFKGVLLED
ncbi:MAG TPA: NETI motif-containing protein [Ureibacillus sp.]|nr:NETI motif-containing protein [Ureibacillus sp.]